MEGVVSSRVEPCRPKLGFLRRSVGVTRERTRSQAEVSGVRLVTCCVPDSGYEMDSFGRIRTGRDRWSVVVEFVDHMTDSSLV